MRTVLLVPAAAATRSTRSANDANGLATVFVYDTQAGTTTLVSMKRSGAQVDDHTVGWDMTNDGRFVAFSPLSRYTADDRNRDTDAYVAGSSRSTGPRRTSCRRSTCGTCRRRRRYWGAS